MKIASIPCLLFFVTLTNSIHCWGAVVGNGHKIWDTPNEFNFVMGEIPEIVNGSLMNLSSEPHLDAELKQSIKKNIENKFLDNGFSKIDVSVVGLTPSGDKDRVEFLATNGLGQKYSGTILIQPRLSKNKETGAVSFEYIQSYLSLVEKTCSTESTFEVKDNDGNLIYKEFGKQN